MTMQMKMAFTKWRPFRSTYAKSAGVIFKTFIYYDVVSGDIF